MQNKVENDIAIIGIACRFPGASNYFEFWNGLISERNTIGEIPPQRWNTQNLTRNEVHGRVDYVSRWCGLVDNIRCFDNEFFNISALEAMSMDPQQRILLQESWHCIEDSAVSLKQLQTARTAVYVGAMTSDYVQVLNRSSLANNRYQILGTDHSLLANRVSYHLNLSGESISLNAASASSLVAIQNAVAKLSYGECDYALAAGVNLNVDASKYEIFSNAGMLSPDGQCFSFSDRANGYVPGDGVGVLLLQPLKAALAQGNQIHGVVKGAAVSHTGHGKFLTAPSVASQVKTINQALQNANLVANDISYVETHGSGTPIGDPIEFEALKRVFSKASSDVVLGTVKPNIGHLEAAAGIASVIKTLLMMRHKIIPKSLNCERINPALSYQSSHISFASQTKPWKSESKHYVGVSSYGIGGTCCHLILGAFQRIKTSQYDIHYSAFEVGNALPSVFVLSAKSKWSLNKSVETWKNYLASDQCKINSVEKICGNLLVGRESFPYRLGFLANSQSDIQAGLANFKIGSFINPQHWISLVIGNVATDANLMSIPLFKNSHLKIINQVREIEKQLELESTKLIENKFLQEVIQQHAIVNALNLIGVLPHLVQGLTRTGQWAALLATGVLSLESFCAIVARKIELNKAILYQPKYAYYDPVSQSIIYPQYVSHNFDTELYSELKAASDSCRSIAKEFLSLLDTPGFLAIFGTWFKSSDLEDGNSLLSMNIDITGLKNQVIETIKFIRDDKQYKTVQAYTQSNVVFAMVCAINCINTNNKKWSFITTDFSSCKKFELLFKLFEEKIICLNDLYSICFELKEKNESWIYEINKSAWNNGVEVFDLASMYPMENNKNVNGDWLEIATSKNQKICSEYSGEFLVTGELEFEIASKIAVIKTSTGLWKSLLDCWLLGSSIDWALLYEEVQLEKISLPGYEFEQSEFWAEPIEQQQQVAPKPISQIVNDEHSKSAQQSKNYSVQGKISTSIKILIAKSLSISVNQIQLERSFESYGFDSMGYTILCEAINAEYATELTPASFYQFNDINKLVYFIDNAVSDINFTNVENLGSLPLSTKPKTTQKIDEGVAIVGFAGIFPNALDTDAFWQNLLTGSDCISEVPESRWRWQDVFSERLGEKNKTPSKWGGFIPNIEYFDAAFFGISPTEAKLMDPQQRILLKSVWKAIEQSGHRPSSLAGSNTGVFVGASTSDYEELVRKYDLVAHAATGMNRSIIANRISFLLDINGPSEIIDTACSSSLVAIHKAMSAIQNGDCDIAIAAGVNALITPTHYLTYGNAGMLSPEGRCKTYDKEANGYVRGEGVGVIILKSLKQAKADNDQIYAVVKASGINHGGRSNSLTAPNPNAQAELIASIYRKNSILPESINYIENHGTGTPLGDPIEIDALKKAFNQLDEIGKVNQSKKTCLLASVKTNIGHLEAAAGIAGVIKVLLSMQHEVLPATRNFEKINPYLKLADSPFQIILKNTEWKKSLPNSAPRRAAISSFGFGGVNAHLVLDEYIDSNKNIENNLSNIFVLSAKTAADLINYVNVYINWLKRIDTQVDYFNLAYTTQIGRDNENYRLAIVASNCNELLSSLIKLAKNESSSRCYSNNEAVKNNLNNKQPADRLEFSVNSVVAVAGKSFELFALIDMAKAWIDGHQIEWHALYQNKTTMRRLALPTYPFNEKYYWIVPSTESLASEQKLLVNEDSKSVDFKTSSSQSNIAEVALAKVVKYTVTADSFLANQHVVNQVAILPGVFALEMICQLRNSLGQSSGFSIKDLCWLDPIGFTETSTTLVLAEMPSIERESSSLKLSTFSFSGMEKIHVIISLKDSTHTIESFQTDNYLFPLRLLSLARSVGDVYTRLTKLGFDYGARFQVLGDFYFDESRFISTINLPVVQNESNEHFSLHPCLLDGVLQSCLVFLLERGFTQTFVPFMLENALLNLPFASSVYVDVECLDKIEKNSNLVSFKLRVFDKKFNMIALFEKVVFKKVSSELNVNSAELENSDELSVDLLSKNSQPKMLIAHKNESRNPSLTTRNVEAKKQEMEPQTVNLQLLLSNTIKYLVSTIAQAVSMSVNEIDINQPFKEYGVDSFLTLSITRGLEQEFGSLRKTLMFEASNIKELADIFVDEQQAHLIKMFNMTQEPDRAPLTQDINIDELLTKQPQLLSERFEEQDPSSIESNVAAPIVIENGLATSQYASKIGWLFSQYGRESIALSRKDIAPKIFLGSKQNGFFYFNVNRKLLLAFRYVGSDEDFTDLLQELAVYCRANDLLINVLCEAEIPEISKYEFSANAFAVVQRISNIQDFNLNGGKMRRLRYQVSKFEQSGKASTFEYIHGSDSLKDQAVSSLIENWASEKASVNPYIWRVKSEMETGCLGSDYRLFLTDLDGSLQNVIIISRMHSDNGYLLDTEFYTSEMAMGGLDYAIWNIIQQLKSEGVERFSLGLTFGAEFYQSKNPDQAVTQELINLSQQNIFSETGNFQFKNKYRCENSLLFLYRPMHQSPSNVIDLIMMIGNPKSFANSEQVDISSRENDSENITLSEAELTLISDADKENVTQLERFELLKASGFNPINLPRNVVEFDLVTDSWSELEHEFIQQRTRSLMSLPKNAQTLESIISNIFQLPYITPFSAGRVAESFFCAAWLKQKRYVIQNVLFPTCVFHQFANEFTPIEIVSNEFYDINSNSIFKGNMDCRKLSASIEEHSADIAFIWVELANNAAGGCSVSIANLREIKSVIGDIPLVLDATRIIENAYHIQEYEVEFKNYSVWDIVKQICSYADVINASLTKDFGTHTGGFIATKIHSLYTNIQDSIATNGSGLSRTDRDVLCSALCDRNFVETQVVHRMKMVSLLAKILQDNHINIILPVGGHCVLVDPMRITALSTLNYPLQSFLAWLFQETAIRAGIHSVGRQKDTSMNNLVRIAVPLGITQTDVEKIGSRLVKFFYQQSKALNLNLQNKPQGIFGEIKANYSLVNQFDITPLAKPEKPKSIELHKDKIPQKNIEQSINGLPTASVAREENIGQSKQSPKNDAIAIVGVAGRYPDANSLDQLWNNLVEGKDSIAMGPDWSQRFMAADTPKHWGGFIDNVDKFDSLFFSISPREAENMDPQERLLMEVSWATLEDAGYFPESLVDVNGSNNVGVFIGAVWSHYELLGAENRESGGTSIANSQHWGISNRISSFMNFSGPSLTVDTACSSSLTAIHLACESIRNGECEIALAGGINLDIHPGKHHITKAAQFLSEDGKCRAFGTGGTGYVAGEGVGTMLLKPLQRAIDDGDQIYAVIKSSVTNHGGRTSGYTVPNPKAQKSLIQQAIRKANIDPETITYIEAHGTGTSLGDPIEVEGATQAFQTFTKKKQFCSLGSIKTNIGHLEAAAGIAGATKLLLQLKHKKLVRSLHSTQLNEYINFSETPFFVQQSNQDWSQITKDGVPVPRRAGLSSFGAGGTNVHIIFEEFDATLDPQSKAGQSLSEQRSQATSSNHLIVLSARKAENLKAKALALMHFVNVHAAGDEQSLLANISYTLQVGRLPMAKRVAFLSANMTQLAQQLEDFVNGNDSTSSEIIYANDNFQASFGLFEGEEKNEIIDIFVRNANWKKIATLWVNGVDIDWSAARKNIAGRRISLPTYPFTKSSHWVPLTEKLANVVTLNRRESSTIHPLVDTNISTFSNQQYTKQFNLEQFVFSQHIVNGLATLPGVGYIEMALAAVSNATASKITVLKNLVWASQINSESSPDIRIKLNYKASDIEYEICTFDEANHKNIHAQGKAIVQPALQTLLSDISTDSIIERCSGFMNKQQCYELLATRNLSYGAQLQSIEGFHFGANEGLTILRLSDVLVAGMNDYIAHPSLLDGAVQSIISLLENSNTPTQPDVPYVPFVLSEFRLIRPLTKNCFAHLVLDESAKSRDDIKKITILLINDDGKIAVQMKDFSFKAISKKSGLDVVSSTSSATRSNVFKPDDIVAYTQAWKTDQEIELFRSSFRLSESFSQQFKTIVVFAEDIFQTESLRELASVNDISVIQVKAGNAFQKISSSVYSINPTSAEDYLSLFEALVTDNVVPDKIVHNWSVEPVDVSPEISDSDYLQFASLLSKQVDTTVVSAFLMIKALLKLKKSINAKTIDVVFLCSSTNAEYQLAQKSINGFILSLKQEGANVNAKTLTFGSNTLLDIEKSWWDLILLELATKDSSEVNYNSNNRMVRSLDEVELTPSIKQADSICLAKNNGVYLITGGLGGLGLLFAEEMINHANVHLILLGRSSISEKQKEVLRKFNTIGSTVEYICCDINKLENVNMLVSDIVERLGSITGIIHAAGVIKDAFLWNKTLENFTQVIQPKIFATRYLDQATQSLALDYFVVFSSIASTLGNMGQSDYAAANRYMDEFSGYRNRLTEKGERTGKTISINWPLWKDGGMQVNEQSLKWLAENWGMRPLSTNTGLATVEYCLNTNLDSFGLVEGDVSQIISSLSIKPAINRTDKTTNAKLIDDRIVTKSSNVSDVEIVKDSKEGVNLKILLKQDLISIVIELLKLAKEDIDFLENMSTYGFDSVTFTEFTNLINNQLSLDVTPLIFFEQETLQELSDYLIEDFAGSLLTHYQSIKATESQVSLDETVVEIKIQAPTDVLETVYSAQKSIDVSDEQTIERVAESLVDDSLKLNREKNLFTTSNKLEKDRTQNDMSNEPIAIIGMSGIMPQSENLDVFWNNLVAEKNLVSEIPIDRWDWKKFYGESDFGNAKTEIKWGGFIPEVDKFDAEFFKISPLEAELTDPQQRMFLQTVWHTVEDSGYTASQLSGSNTGVFVGIGTSDYHELLREQNSEFEAYSVMGWMHAVLANRISYFFNWKGPSEPIGTACSSSLVAIDRAVQSIRSGKVDLCIAGGISLIINPGLHIGLGKASMLSPDGKCKTFDHKANGYVRSEGVGALLLKPLSKAKADGDNIYAVIRGSAVNHGGHVNTFTTPNPKAQTDVLKMAFKDAAIDPATLTYIEAHGTGTALGDPIEMQALLNAFKGSANKDNLMPENTSYCAVGSVKTNVGHLELAAGMAGMFKLLLAFKHQKIPASINFEKVNPYIKLDDTPLRLVEKTQSWERIKDRQGQIVPRRAGISSFGFGGVNAHIILEEYQKETKALAQDDQQGFVFTLSTKYSEGLKIYVVDILQFIRAKQLEGNLPEFAEFMLGFNLGREVMSCRLAFVANDFKQLVDSLEKYVDGRSDPALKLNLASKNKTGGIGSEEISTMFNRGELNEIAQLWVDGVAINWAELYTPVNKVSLPVYPFKKNRYWLLNPQPRGAIERKSDVASTRVVHTSCKDITLQALKLTKNSDIFEFDIVINSAADFLQEHQISGLKLLPAATYLELVNLACIEINAVVISEFEDVFWLNSITESCLNNSIRLVVERNGKHFNFSISSPSQQKALYYCQGAFNIDQQVNTLENKSNNDWMELKQSMALEECYNAFANRGFVYGNSLKVVQQLGLYEGQTVSSIILPSPYENNYSRTVLYTSLLDGALQTILGMFVIQHAGEKIQVPVSVSKIVWISELSRKIYVRVKEISESKPLDGSSDIVTSGFLRLFDIEIYNSDKNLAMVIRGLELRPLMKLDRNSIQQKLADSSVDAAEHNSKKEQYSDVVKFLSQLISEETKVDVASISIEDSFEKFGIDSFLALRMTKKLEKRIGQISKSAFFENTTVKSLANYLLTNFQSQLGNLNLAVEGIPLAKPKAIAKPELLSDKLNSNDRQVSAQEVTIYTVALLAQLIAEECRVDISIISPDDEFEKFGIDSFLALRMTKKLEKKTGKISKSAFFEHSTLLSLANYLSIECREQLEILCGSLPLSANSESSQNKINEKAEDNQLVPLIQKHLIQLLAQETRVSPERIGLNDTFDQFGIDSFLALRMTKKLEKDIGSVSKSAFFEHTTINGLADYLFDGFSDKFKIMFSLDENIESSELNAGDQQILNSEIISEDKEFSIELKLFLQDLLIKLVVDETKTDIKDVNILDQFENFGIDSFLALRMTKKLERHIGQVDKSAFFEYTSIDSLANYLISANSEALISAFNSQLNVGQVISNQQEKHAAVDEKPSFVVISESELQKQPDLSSIVNQINNRFGRENSALARGAIAPLIFIGSNRNAFFNFNMNEEIAFAFTYVGDNSNLEQLATEFSLYCTSRGIRTNILTERVINDSSQVQFTANSIGVMQRLPSLQEISLQGGKMKRLRYQISKFESAGICRCEEYTCGTSKQTDAQIIQMIDRWAAQKKMVNPYVWDVKKQITAGSLPALHRIFITHSNDTLQNVIIITQLASENGYLMDLEFYSEEMPLGGLEYSIWEILQVLRQEGSQSFSLGGTFGVIDSNDKKACKQSTDELLALHQQGTFNGQGNLQFKNKFRPENTVLYLNKLTNDQGNSVVDVIMMMANPQIESALTE